MITRSSKIIFLILSCLIIFTLLMTKHVLTMREIYVVTVMPYLNRVVKVIGGIHVKVDSIIPYGVDPHNYEPSINELLKVYRAQIIVMTGPSHLPVEEKIKSMIAKGEIKAIVVDYRDYLKQGLKPLYLPNGEINPHGYFISYNGLKAIAKAILNALIRVDPEHSKYYKDNFESYIKYLNSILNASKHVTKDLNVSVCLLTPIMSYVLRDLNIRSSLIVMYSHEYEPSLRDLNVIVKKYRCGLFDVVIVSSLEYLKLKKIIDYLESNNVPIIVVDTLSKCFVEHPELIILETALKAREYASGVGTPLYTSKPRSAYSILKYVIITLVIAVIVCIFIIIALVKKIKEGA